MAEDHPRTHAEIIADICAEPEHKLGDVRARMNAIPEEERARLYNGLLWDVRSWLRAQEDFEAAFRHAAHDLVAIGAFIIRTMEKRLGHDISPAAFATSSYAIADDILHWDEFEAEAVNYFDEVFNPSPPAPPDPEDVAHDELQSRLSTYIVEYLFTQSEPAKRSEIIEYVLDRYRTTGGLKSRAYMEARYREAIRHLVMDRRIRRKHRCYSLIGGGPELTTMESTGGTEPVAPAPSEPVEVRELFIPEETIGDGDELVYVYFNEAERKLATHEGRDWWPCKIGCTSSTLTTRIIAQSPRTSIRRRYPLLSPPRHPHHLKTRRHQTMQ